jgi:hypothetical protein
MLLSWRYEELKRAADCPGSTPKIVLYPPARQMTQSIRQPHAATSWDDAPDPT